jgi:hypothetical protein
MQAGLEADVRAGQEFERISPSAVLKGTTSGKSEGFQYFVFHIDVDCENQIRFQNIYCPTD